MGGTLAAVALAVAFGSVWACASPYGDGSSPDEAIPRVETDAANDAESRGDGGTADASAAGATCAVRGVYAVGRADLSLNMLDPKTAKTTRIGAGAIECKPLLDAAGPSPSFFYESMAIGRDGHARIIAGPVAGKRYVVRVALATGKCTGIVPTDLFVVGLAAVRDVAGDVYYATTFEEVAGKKGEYLHQVDPATGNHTRVGLVQATSAPQSVVLVDSTDNRLFAVRQRTSTALELAEIDRKTGAVLNGTAVKTSGTILGGVHTPQTTWLFASSTQAPQVWAFDHATGETKLVAPDVALDIRSVGVDVACD